MAFVALTKQLAQQAIGNQVKNVVDSLRPAELSSMAEKVTPASGAAPAAPGLAPALVAQVQAMQNALKEDHELLVVCHTGLELLRVVEIFMPSPDVLVLTGFDTEKALTRFVTPAQSVQLTCKPVAVDGEAKPVRIRFILPKPKPE